MKSNSRRLERTVKALRWIPAETPGKARLARRLLGSCLEERDVRVDGRYGVKLVTPSIREPVGFFLLVDGVYESEVLDFVFGRLRPGAVVVDVGANIGAFTLPVAKEVGTAGRVIAIEASPRVFPYLERNVILNELLNVRPVHCAAFNSDWQTVSFYETSIDRFGKGSLGTHFQADRISVPTRTLDSILSEQQVGRVDLIKMDVEGSEALVLQGAERLLTGDNPPAVVFEFCDWAEESVLGGQAGCAQRLLRDWGYRVWRLKDVVKGKASLEDVLTNGFEMLVAARNS
jgi:FkbM family methyltransferase